MTDMESTQVIIVGAGPSGLSMGLALAKRKVKSIILEKESQPDQDPRGVYLNGDAVRILWALGIREQEFAAFAGEPEAVHFFRTCITNRNGPFFTLRTREDFLHQALPGGVTHVQPKLEASIAQAAVQSGYCEIRRGCTVESQELLGDGRIVITYKDNDTGITCHIQCNYLVGADGKRGVVRKSFLEPSTSIRQVSNPKFQYEGTWIAANLQLTLPTPDSHPDFPLWQLGYKPQAVYDLFCPREWYFCCPPGKPTAGGRFGPAEERCWRHEFAQPDWNDSMDAEALFWEHFTPFVTRTHDEQGHKISCGATTYPLDCVKILRCRSFTFTHKVVNRWFDCRRILIGDAAHVFPPFGGQGIASGLRDAHQLAWRMALLEAEPDATEAFVDKLLGEWARERRESVDAATFQTKMNGRLCNEPETWSFYFFRKLLSLYEMLPLVPPPANPVTEVDRRGFTGVEGGCFLAEYRGGPKFPQVFVDMENGRVGRSDDILLAGPASVFTLVVLRNEPRLMDEVAAVVRKSSLPGIVLTEDSIVVLNDANPATSASLHHHLRPVTPSGDCGLDVRPGYRKEVLREWLGKWTIFAILRPDFHTFALLKTVAELEDALRKMRRMMTDSPAGAML